MSHSQEPWIASEYGRYLGGAPWSIMSLGNPDVTIAKLTDKADAARIVTCVNFCRQFDTEFLEERQLINSGDGCFWVQLTSVIETRSRKSGDKRTR